jgi:hypothetical protein
MTAFTFNGDYRDYAQVAQYIGDFARARDEILAAGEYPYDASFRGRIPGDFNREQRERVEGDHETAAIYMLQGLYRAWEQEAQTLTLLAQGYEWLDELDATERFRHVVLCPTDRMGGEWREYRDARVTAEGGRPCGILPKGKRTHGFLVSGRRVLVARVTA